MAHEVLVDLFKNRPELGPEMLTEALGVALPSYNEARLVSIDLTQIRPAEYRADVVVLLLDDGAAISVVIVEVQLAVDDDKHFTWPEYTTGARARYRCPASLLIVAPQPEIAAWCAEPIDTGIPGFVLTPPVLGCRAVPVITDPVEAARRPELAVLSAMAHGESERGPAIAAAVLAAVRGLSDERARFYGDLVLNSMNEAARRALEAMMKGYEYQSDFAKKYYGQGRQEGERALLLKLLCTRFGELPASAVARVESAEVALIERWGERMLSAKTLADVLDDPS
jgi:hypothetical protein